MMVAAAASTAPNLKTPSQGRAHLKDPARPPLLPSESDDNVVPHRRPKSREVTSRYLSTSSSSSTSTSSSSSFSNSSNLSSRRYPSPIASRAAASATPLPSSSVIQRSRSVERRRPATPRPDGGGIGGPMSTAAKLLMSSRRNLSVSFQGEPFSMPSSKTKPALSPNLRKGTPEKRRTPSMATTPRKEGDQEENTRPIDQQRWPARSRQVNSLSRSMDLGDDSRKVANGSGNSARALQKSLTDEGNRVLSNDKWGKDLKSTVLMKGVRDAVVDTYLANRSTLASESVVYGKKSVCSENNSGEQDDKYVAQSSGEHRNIFIPARVWQETNNRLRRAPEPVSPSSKSNSVKTTVVPKLNVPKKLSSASSPRGNMFSRAFSSPLRDTVRPASPCKLGSSSMLEKSSPSRGLASPIRQRNTIAAAMVNTATNTPSLLSFAADVRRGKVGENRIGDAHLLRLLYNRQLQWRYVNARAEDALSIQRLNAERSLYNAWKTTSDLYGAVSAKQKELQWMRQKLKLTSILKGQILYLEEWAVIEKDYCSSLSGAIESLKTSTARLPLVCGARADVPILKDAISSAVDVMQAMASSLCFLPQKVEEVSSLVAEVARVSSKERALLDECKDILSALAAMQVSDCSLRTNLLQLKRAP
ncbi:hypothetical protein Nepgr_005015 [Nepenthes gracilis]|uniref:QWRF motif-containing protein 2 n=1 Tax=Nepenthes gracilis TaxID=150966 RepID=A0AAD3S2I5_NEPGR|nr:hypothetical protein Nepgr_005015 [Nepenthes gracilis]